MNAAKKQDLQGDAEGMSSLDTVRERLVNYTLLTIAIGGIPAILAGLPRSLAFGFKPVQYFVHSAYVLVVFVYLFRHRIPYVLRAGFLIAIITPIGIFSLLDWGLIGMYSVYMMAAIFMAVIFFGIRGGVAIAAALVAGEVIIAVLVSEGVVSYDFDFNEFARAPVSWGLSLGHIALYGAVLILCFGFVQRALVHTIGVLEKRTEDLDRARRKMEREVIERRRLEDQLVQSQKMEAIGRLAGGVAHDFNNHLMVIINLSEMLKLELEDDEVKRRQLEMIEKAGVKAADLTRQLLAFSRKQVVDPAVLDLNDTLYELEKMLRRLIGEDVKLEFKLEDKPWSVLIDPTQIEQVIINLAVNARDAMPDGGILLIETRNVELDRGYADFQDPILPGEYFMLSVSDTGHGMDRETMSRVFEPFFTTKGMDKGTGLGLATVYGIVKQAGGAINIYSEPGSGTTFKAYLPRVDRDIEKRERREEAGLSLEGAETVLVVEDEELVRKTTAHVLAGKGYKVVEAESGERALQIVDREKIEVDMVITDVIMTGMNGKELSIEIEKRNPRAKFLFVSGYADEIIASHGVLDDDVLFLQKPFSSQALLKKVRQGLDKTA